MNDAHKSRDELLLELGALRARVAALEKRAAPPAPDEDMLSDLRHLYRTAPVGLCVVDRETRFVHINELLAKLNGRTVAEHIGRPFFEVAPQIAERIRPILEKVIATGTPARFEMRAAAGDDPDHERDWLVHYEPVISSRRETLGVSVVLQDVSEQRSSSEALHEAEEIRRSISEISPDFILRVDREARIEFINRVDPEYSMDAVIGSSLYDYSQPEELPIVKECIERVLATGEPGRFESDVQNPSGTVRTYESHVGPIKRAGEITGLTIVSRDITARKQIEQTLEHRESQYRSIFENSTDGLVVLSPDGHFADANPAACRMHGYTRDEFLRSPPYDLIHPDSHEQFEQFLQELQAGGTYHAVGRGLRKDGTTFDQEVRGTLLDYAGQPHFLASLRDVTEARRAEESLRQAHDELNHLMSSVSDYMWSGEIDRDGAFRYRYYSPVVEKITGRPPEFFTSNPAQWLSTVHPDDRPRLEAALERILSRRSSREVEEYRVVRPDGTLRWVRDSVTIAPLGDGTLRVYGVVSDVTQRVTADAKIKESEEWFRTIFNSVGDGIYLFDEHLHRLDVNQGACDQCGYTREELLETEIGFASIEEPPYTSESLWHRFEQAAREGTPQRYIWPAKHRSGQRWWADVAIRPVKICGENRILSVVRDITETREAEEKLRQMSKVYMDAADPIIIEDMSRRVVDLNSEAERVYGWTRQELLGKSIETLIPPERRDPARVLAERGHQGEVIRNLEGMRLHKDGTRIPILVTLSLLTDESGDAVGIASIAKHIAHLKKTETALRESEERFRQIFNSVNDAIFVYDKTGKRLDANHSATILFGYTRDELLAGSVGAFSAGGPRYTESEAMEWFLQAVADGQTRLCEWQFRHRSGRIWWANKQIKPITIGGQELMLGVVRDVTAHKLAEVRVLESERRFRTLVETMNEGLAVMDRGLVITYVNDRFCQISGYAQDELVGKSALSLLGDHAKQLFAGSRLRRRQHDLQSDELSILRKDGARIHTLISPSPIFDTQNTITGSFIVVTEITQLKEATEELRRIQKDLERRVKERTRDLARTNETLKLEIHERVQAEAKVRQLNTGLERTSRLRVLGEVAAGIAHQLHQPLAAIAYSAEGCRRRLENGQAPVTDLMEQLEEIAAESLRAGEIIRRIRAFVAEQQLARAPLDVNQVVRDALRLIKFNASEHGIRLEDRLADSLPEVLADEIQLIQVVLNLVLNGMESMSDTDPDRRTLSVRTLLDNGIVRVDVADRGHGIDPDVGEQIFDQFYSTKPKGLGIGLAISRSIVEAHYGELWYEPAPDGGTVFRFTLPAPGAESLD